MSATRKTCVAAPLGAGLARHCYQLQSLAMWREGMGMPASAALFVFLASEASEFITGQVISPNGGGLM
jgi:hypothetical protein